MFFKSDGDYFRVCDTLDDAWNVYAKYEYIRIGGSIQTGEHYVTGGQGTCKDFDHNFGEGRYVWFRACRDVPLGTDNCAPWREAIA